MNWRVRHFQFSYLIGELPEAAIRDQMIMMFATPEGRQWWAMARQVYRASIKRRKEREYFAIVDGTYAACLRGAP